jgi:hypothetical protein
VLSGPAPVAVTGTLELSFAPNAAAVPAGYADPAMVFVLVGPNAGVNFTIDAGRTTAQIPGDGAFNTGHCRGRGHRGCDYDERRRRQRPEPAASPRRLRSPRAWSLHHARFGPGSPLDGGRKRSKCKAIRRRARSLRPRSPSRLRGATSLRFHTFTVRSRRHSPPGSTAIPAVTTVAAS